MKPAVPMLVVALLAVWPALVTAQPPSAASARELAGAAVERAREGDYEPAVELFRRALAADPALQEARFQLARVLTALGRHEEAGAEFARVVAAEPENGAARRGEVTALLLLERYAEARRRLEEGLTALPRDGQLAHTLARLLATAPDEGVRDGELAVRLARAVYEIKKLYETGETLAMAWAESGELEAAIGLQRELVRRAEREGESERLAGLRERLATFESGRPWRAATPLEIATATEPPRL